MEISYPERVSRLNKHIGQGTLIRKNYTGKDSKGRQTACLLAALSPEVAQGKNAVYCPADVMPRWLAHLTPTIDDAGSDGIWEVTIRRYASLAADWHLLDRSVWDVLAIKALQIAMLECKSVTPKERWDAVSERLEGFLTGNPMPETERALLCRVIVNDARFMKDTQTMNARAALSRALNRNPLESSMVERMWGAASLASVLARGFGSTALASERARASIDRMTNLLFDAIEKEIDIAKEALT